MNIFKKKKIKPVMAYLHISLNLSKIREHLKNTTIVGVEGCWSSYDDEIITHTVNVFLKDDIYFHKSLGEFSHTLSSISSLGKGFGELEWNIFDDYFVVTLSPKRDIVFCCPLLDVRQLINGEHLELDNILNVTRGSVIELEKTYGYCEKVLKSMHMSQSGVMYSNDLVRFDFSTPSSGHMVDYTSSQ